MRRPSLNHVAAAWLALALMAPAAAAPQADTEAFIVIHVSGVRALPWKSYRAMRAAMAAYVKFKSLAPDTSFRFAVLAPRGKTLPPNFKLRVRGRNGDEFPIALEEGGLFQLPLQLEPGADADLVSNFKDGPLRIGLLVHTRGVDADKERLGDVRLRALINNAIADADNPDHYPGCLRRLERDPGCRPRDPSIWFRPRAPASAAWLVDGQRRQALATRGDPAFPAFEVPVLSWNLSDDALIEFAFGSSAPPAGLPVVAIEDATDRDPARAGKR